MYLHTKLDEIGIKHLYDQNKVPLFVPIFVEPVKRDRIRKRMFENNIFCPIHWKNIANDINNLPSNILYDMELSLICDQRYDLKDMERIIEILADEYSC